jgi:hypothetical protein
MQPQRPILRLKGQCHPLDRSLQGFSTKHGQQAPRLQVPQLLAGWAGGQGPLQWRLFSHQALQLA